MAQTSDQPDNQSLLAAWQKHWLSAKRLLMYMRISNTASKSPRPAAVHAEVN